MKTRKPSEQPHIEVAFHKAADDLCKARAKHNLAMQGIRQDIHVVDTYLHSIPVLVDTVAGRSDKGKSKIAKKTTRLKHYKLCANMMRDLDAHITAKENKMLLRLFPLSPIFPVLEPQLRDRMAALPRTKDSVQLLNAMANRYRKTTRFFEDKTAQTLAAVEEQSKNLPINYMEYVIRRTDFTEAFNAAPSRAEKRVLALKTFPGLASFTLQIVPK